MVTARKCLAVELVPGKVRSFGFVVIVVANVGAFHLDPLKLVTVKELPRQLSSRPREVLLLANMLLQHVLSP